MVVSIFAKVKVWMLIIILVHVKFWPLEVGFVFLMEMRLWIELVDWCLSFLNTRIKLYSWIERFLTKSVDSEKVVSDSTWFIDLIIYIIKIADGVMVKLLSGSGDKGYIDGEPGLARFNKPKSFTVDLRGNVYVADQLNHAVRKISSSGAFNCKYFIKFWILFACTLEEK